MSLLSEVRAAVAKLGYDVRPALRIDRDAEQTIFIGHNSTGPLVRGGGNSGLSVQARCFKPIFCLRTGVDVLGSDCGLAWEFEGLSDNYKDAQAVINALIRCAGVMIAIPVLPNESTIKMPIDLMGRD